MLRKAKGLYGGALLAALASAALPAASAFGAAKAGRFAVDEPGKTVYDKVTKLTWQRQPPDQRFDWADAKAYCSGAPADLPGSGWRLPTIRELESLVDLKAKEGEAVIDAVAFPNTPLHLFWSVTPSQVGVLHARHVNFYNGYSNSSVVSRSHSVRCVR